MRSTAIRYAPLTIKKNCKKERTCQSTSGIGTSTSTTVRPQIKKNVYQGPLVQCRCLHSNAWGLGLGRDNGRGSSPPLLLFSRTVNRARSVRIFYPSGIHCLAPELPQMWKGRRIDLSKRAYIHTHQHHIETEIHLRKGSKLAPKQKGSSAIRIPIVAKTNYSKEDIGSQDRDSDAR